MRIKIRLYGSIFKSSSSVSVLFRSPSRATTAVSNASSVKRQAAAAEYEGPKGVIQITTEQEKQTVQMLEEDKCITAEQEAAATSQHLLEEEEETEHKLKREQESSCDKETRGK